MEDFHRDWCIKLMNKLKRKSYHNVYTRNLDGEMTVNFDMVFQKLNDNKYATPFDFSIDLTNMFFEFEDHYDEKSTEFIIIKDTLSWIDRQFSKIPKNPMGELVNKTKKKVDQLKDMVDIMTYVSSSKEDPGGFITPEDLENLQTLMNSIDNASLLAQVIAILKKSVEDFTAEDHVTIKRKKITKKCYNDIQMVIYNYRNESGHA